MPKRTVAFCAFAAALLFESPAAAEQIRLDCNYGNQSASLLIDDQARTAFKWESGEWRTATLSEYSAVRARVAYARTVWEVSRTDGSVRAYWWETYDHGDRTRTHEIGTGYCQRVQTPAGVF